MHVKILGPGCKNCADLEARTRTALGELGVDAEITKVTDVVEIAQYGIMRTPGLVVDDQVLASGRVPSPTHVRELLAEHIAAHPA
ncbi:MAG: TM0996/MTH895 family glutaredoxin-like protein [Acidimicrobiales bacterium]|nr:TM0996/MTH895 family glutaredoxin-like protein [Acidimicrobiales bacterium]